MKRRAARLKTPETVGSICSGIGALEAAVPGDARWVTETNTAAAKVLLREYPDADNLGDITVPGLDPEPVDLLVSGDPCQSMSPAGRQMASEDERFLWPDVMRLVERVRPDQVFFENTEGVVSVPLFPGAARGTVLAMRLDDLWRAGYAVRWTVLGACAVGAPHHRHRWFLRGRWFGLGAPAPVRVGRKAWCGAPRSGGRVLLPTPRTTDTNGPGRAKNLQGGVDLRTAVSLLPTPDVWGKYAEAVALWEQTVMMPAPSPIEEGPKGRRLNRALPEWMMGYPPGYLTGDLGRADAIRCAGNGVVTLQAQAAWDMLGTGL